MNNNTEVLRSVDHSIVVVIDVFTKQATSSITYDVLTKHVSVVTDIRELDDSHYKSSVVVFEPALGPIATPEILTEFKSRLDLDYYIVHQNEDVVKPYASLATLVKADYGELSWNFVYAVINKDLSILEPYQRSLRILDSFKPLLDKIPQDMQDYMQRYRFHYLELVRATASLIAENARLHDIVTSQAAIGKQTIEGLSELKSILDKTQGKVNAYEAMLSESYDVTFGGFYPERPRVLYIKQISHVASVDTLLSVLFSVLTKQYKSSCKVVKLVDSTNALNLRYIPNNYVTVTDPYNTAELLTNEWIVKLGAYNILFDTLMLNRSGLEYLIVHDMRGVMKSAIDPSLVDLSIYEISADYAILGEYDSVLSDLDNRCRFPWSFKECQKHTGSSAVKLANHPTIGSILDILMS